MSAQTEKFQYSINIGYPKNYGATYESTQSYFMDSNGEPIIYFGGWLAAAGEWGDGAQATGLSEENILPAAFKIRWFSATENQFWEGEFKLPQQELYQLVKTGYQDVFNQGHSTYSEFTINVTPGGLVALWLGGDSQKIHVGDFQADKTDMDWQVFADNSLGGAWAEESRVQFVDEAINSKQLSEQVKYEIKTNTLPTDSAYWKRLQRKYLWRLQVSAPFVLLVYRAWYANGESLYTYANKTDDYQNTAVPYKISFLIKCPNKDVEKMVLEMDQKQILDAFIKLDGSKYNKLDFYVQISENLKQADVYLKNKDEEVKLDIKAAYLTD